METELEMKLRKAEPQPPFLTEEERRDLKKLEESDLDLVGRVPSAEDVLTWSLIKAFQDFPVQWSNSSDLLYTEEEEMFKLRLPSEPKITRPNLPWVYQDGRIFKVRLLLNRPRALLLKARIGKFWVPRAQVDYDSGEVWLPMWLIKEKGLEGEIDKKLNPKFEWEPALLAKGKVNKPRRSLKGGKR